MKTRMFWAFFFVLCLLSITSCSILEPSGRKEESPGGSSIAERKAPSAHAGISGEGEAASLPKEDSRHGEKGSTAGFDLETGRVMLNSGHEMPINGLGT